MGQVNEKWSKSGSKPGVTAHHVPMSYTIRHKCILIVLSPDQPDSEIYVIQLNHDSRKLHQLYKLNFRN